MELVCYIIATLLIILGFVGCIVPIVPGPILSYCALFCLIPTISCPNVTTFVLLGVLTILVTIGDSIIPVIGAKKFDCSRAGAWGCFIGTIVGVFFFPIGLVAGPFGGAFIGELISGKTARAALRGGIGALLGFLAGTALKIIVCVNITIIMVLCIL